MRQTIVSIAISLIVLIGAIGMFRLLSAQRKPAPKLEKIVSIKKVKAQTVENAATSAEIDITGRLSAVERIELFAEVSGTYQATGTPFKEGAYYKKGTPMIKIDDREFGLTLRAQKSSLLNQITLMLPDMKSDYASSFPAWEKYVADFDPNKALTPLPTPQSEQERYYLSAKNIYNLFYTIEAQDVRQEKYIIKAPFSGKVSESSITSGTLVRTGQKLGEFFNPYSYDLEGAVNLKDLNFVKIGSTVALRSEDIAGKWNGKVVRISDAIDPNTQTVKVFIRVGGQGLKDGMYLEGAIKGQALKDVVELPRAVLVGDTAVYAIQGDTLHLMSIIPVRYSAGSVLARGIPNGTQLVNESLIGAFEGMKVEAYQ